MIHVSKPTYDMVFLETLFGNINVTIKVSSSFNPTSTLARQTRRTINNPNVYYIYVGFEPRTDDKDYEAVSIVYENAIDNNNSKVVMNQIRCGLFSIIHKNEIAIVDGRTIYIPAPTASKNLFEEIKTYISNPKAYEMGFLMSQIGKIYEKLTTDELNNISGLTQTQKNAILELANNSNYFSTEATLSNLEEYSKLQLDAYRSSIAQETVGLSSSTLTYGDYVGKQEQIDIAKALGAYKAQIQTSKNK